MQASATRPQATMRSWSPFCFGMKCAGERHVVWKGLAAKEKGLPSYTALQQVPCRGLPRQLREREDSEDFSVWRKRIETELLCEQHSGDRPGFATFLKAGNGLLQLRIPELEGGCLLFFSTPVRAA